MADFETREAELREWFDAAPFSTYLAQELAECGAGRATVRLPPRPEFDQGTGVTHGGILVAIADTAGYFAAASSLSAGRVATVGLTFSFLAPTQRAVIEARGSVAGRSRGTIVCDLRVTGGDGGLLGVGQATYRILDAASPAVR